MVNTKLSSAGSRATWKNDRSAT